MSKVRGSIKVHSISYQELSTYLKLEDDEIISDITIEEHPAPGTGEILVSAGTRDFVMNYKKKKKRPGGY